jgi:hypothetical protein
MSSCMIISAGCRMGLMHLPPMTEDLHKSTARVGLGDAVSISLFHRWRRTLRAMPCTIRIARACDGRAERDRACLSTS